MSATGSPSSPVRRTDSPPHPKCLTLASGLVLDARRAVFLPEFSVLAVADLHLGYSWAQRSRGLLLPVETPDSTPSRLTDLVRDHAPQTVVLLGDLVQRAIALPALRTALEDLCRSLAGTQIVLCLGNHDLRFEQLASDWHVPITITPELRLGRWRLCHGDDPPAKAGTPPMILESEPPLTVIGHEHPAVELNDGLATRVRVPCFLVSDNLVILPAFSDWAAGSVVGRHSFLGKAAQSARFHTAYACLGPRLLPLPLGRRGIGK